MDKFHNKKNISSAKKMYSCCLSSSVFRWFEMIVFWDFTLKAGGYLKIKMSISGFRAVCEVKAHNV